MEYCRESDTVIEAAAPLARTEIFEDDVVAELAEKYDRAPAPVVFRWAIENDVVVLPKSSSLDHVRENLDAFDWKLDDDRHRLDAADRNEPVYDLPSRDWTGDVYGISE